jgi:hypothetical protein
MAMLARYAKHGLLDRGLISFHGSRNRCHEEINDFQSLLSSHSKGLISDFLMDGLDLPLTLDRTEIDGAASAHFGDQEYDIRQSGLFNVVNETVFYEHKLHLTEKIFQPIVCMRPFLLVAAAGNLEYLRSYGFKTFGDFIDESYDHEPDDDKRMDMIVDQLISLSNLSIDQLRGLLERMRPILIHNKKHFFGKFREIIVDELIFNFDHCLRTWNNGRIDDRSVSLHPDLKLVKKILLL